MNVSKIRIHTVYIVSKLLDVLLRHTAYHVFMYGLRRLSRVEVYFYVIYVTYLHIHVDVFPEQDPIDSGKILQTIQRIDCLVLSTFTRFLILYESV